VIGSLGLLGVLAIAKMVPKVTLILPLARRHAAIVPTAIAQDWFSPDAAAASERARTTKSSEPRAANRPVTAGDEHDLRRRRHRLEGIPAAPRPRPRCGGSRPLRWPRRPLGRNWFCTP
jgi:hypothetical protein